MGAKSKSVFRKPQNIGERRASKGLSADKRHDDTDIALTKFKDRSAISKLPDEREDKYPAAQKDRSRGKPTYSKARKAKASTRWTKS